MAFRTEELRGTLSKLELSGHDTRIIKVLGPVGERDTDSRNHIDTTLTIAIARAMGLSRQQIAVIERGALLHDVGQVPALRDILLQADELLPDGLASCASQATTSTRC